MSCSCYEGQFVFTRRHFYARDSVCDNGVTRWVRLSVTPQLVAASPTSVEFKRGVLVETDVCFVSNFFRVHDNR
jgi:hypothetical protein